MDSYSFYLKCFAKTIKKENFSGPTNKTLQITLDLAEEISQIQPQHETKGKNGFCHYLLNRHYLCIYGSLDGWIIGKSDGEVDNPGGNFSTHPSKVKNTKNSPNQ